MYTQTRPQEHKSIITAWTIPACREIKVFEEYYANPELQNIVSIFPSNGVITFYRGSVYIMQLKPKDKVKFIILDELIFCCKTHAGTTIFGIPDREFLRTKATRFTNEIKKLFGAGSLPLKCLLKPTDSFFDGNQLFQLTTPRRYTKHFLNKTKTT